MTKYRNLIFGILLSLISGSIGVLGYHQIGGYKPKFSLSIVGPTTANAGELLEYSINIQNMSFWASKPTIQWDISESTTGSTNFRSDPNGIFFVAAPTSTQYHIVAAASTYYNYLIYGYQVPLGIFTQDVPVGNPSPTPTPPPDNVPDGKFKISSVSYSLFQKIPIKDRSSLANQIGANYTSVSTSIRAAAITTLDDVFKIIKTKNQATLTAANISSTVFSEFDSAIRQKIYDLYNSKQLKKLGDFADFFDEVVQGLSYVK